MMMMMMMMMMIVMVVSGVEVLSTFDEKRIDEIDEIHV